MEQSFQERLIAALKDRFAGIAADFGPITGTDRLSGVLVWGGFEEMDFVQRQETVWQFLRNTFGPEATQVSTLVTLTPTELEEYSPVT